MGERNHKENFKYFELKGNENVYIRAGMIN